MTPSIASAVPACLGLNVAGATTVSYEDAGLGAGWHHTVVRAPLVTPSPWWQFASGRLVVPYSVGVTAEGHACVPDEPLPVAMSATVPVVDSDWALFVNQQVIARQVAATWKAGGLCGARVGATLTWTATDWIGEWTALHAMDGDMAISARVWPESAPRVSFVSQDGQTGVEAHVDAGMWSVELLSYPAMLTPVSPPLSAAGTLSGSAWARAPITVFAIRNPVSPRAATAAGRVGLTMEPGGATIWIGRK